eukprot:gene8537-9449_t
MRCPVCNRKFTISMIEEHVDACLQSKETSFIALQSSEDEADNFSAKEPEICQDLCGGPMSSECKELLVQAVKVCHYKMAIDVTLNIGRGHEFSDFTKFFKKPWNAKKQGGAYRICYIAEAGIDSGGVSREFYSRAIMEVKSNHFIGTDDNGYEPYNKHWRWSSDEHWTFICSSLPPGSCYREIYEEVIQSNLHNNLYSELIQASDDNRVKEFVTSDAGLELLEIFGYRGLSSSRQKLNNNYQF